MKPLVSFVLLFATLSFISIKKELGDSPYMDEIFHIGQSQSYCEFDYTSWDPKITTFPGSYIIPALVSNCCQMMHQYFYSSYDMLLFRMLRANKYLTGCWYSIIRCNASYLRFWNLIYTCLLYSVIYQILRHKHAPYIAKQLGLIGGWMNSDSKMKEEFQVTAKMKNIKDIKKDNKKLSKLTQLNVELSQWDLHCILNDILVDYTLEILLCPINFFFIFLCYTDISSLFWVLLCYYCHCCLDDDVNNNDDDTEIEERKQTEKSKNTNKDKNKNTNKNKKKQNMEKKDANRNVTKNEFSMVKVFIKVLLILMNLFCLLQRQTNIIWIGFCYLCKLYKKYTKHEIDEEPSIVGFLKWFLTKELLIPISNLFKHIFVLYIEFYFVFFSFILFFILNNFQIVIGDTSNHQFSLHLAQVLYFFLFLFVFGIGISHLLNYGLIKDFITNYLFSKENYTLDLQKLMENSQNQENTQNTSSSSSTNSVQGSANDKNNKNNKLQFINLQLGIFVCIISIFYVFFYKYRVIHIFLLSDNRHYSFYFARYFLYDAENSIFKSKFGNKNGEIIQMILHWCLIIFTSSIAMFSYYISVKRGRETNDSELSFAKNTLWIANKPILSSFEYFVYLFCSFVTLILTPLFEFRYFLIPFILWKLMYFNDAMIICHIIRKKCKDLYELHYQEVSDHSENSRTRGRQSPSIIKMFSLMVQSYMNKVKLFFKQNIRNVEWNSSIIYYSNVIVFIVIDLITMYIFICKPFVWNDETVARFMW